MNPTALSERCQFPAASDGAEPATLAGQINREHRQCGESLRAGLQHALEAGRLLIEAKGLCPHGTWDSWLAENFEGSDRTARAYMRVAREWPKLEGGNRQRTADLTLDWAIRALASNSRIVAARPKAEQRQLLKAWDEHDCKNASEATHQVERERTTLPAPIVVSLPATAAEQKPPIDLKGMEVRCPKCGCEEGDEDGTCISCGEPNIVRPLQEDEVPEGRLGIIKAIERLRKTVFGTWTEGSAETRLAIPNIVQAIADELGARDCKGDREEVDAPDTIGGNGDSTAADEPDEDPAEASRKIIERTNEFYSQLDKPKSRGKGVDLANEALNALTRIPKNDALRERGFQIVTDWIEQNRGAKSVQPEQTKLPLETLRVLRKFVADLYEAWERLVKEGNLGCVGQDDPVMVLIGKIGYAYDALGGLLIREIERLDPKTHRRHGATEASDR